MADIDPAIFDQLRDPVVFASFLASRERYVRDKTLADVLDALRDHDGFVEWTRTNGPSGYLNSYVGRDARDLCAHYLAERFAPTAPEGWEPTFFERRASRDPSIDHSSHSMQWVGKCPECPPDIAPEGADERNGHG